MNSSTSASKSVFAQAAWLIADLLLFLVLLWGFDRGLFGLFRKYEYSFYRTQSLAEKLKKLPDPAGYQVLILGTSRTYEGLHPRYIEKGLGVRVYKEAFVGKGPKYNYYFYLEYKRRMGIPKMVIYGLDYFIYNITSERKLLLRFPEVIEASASRDWHWLQSVANKARIDEFSNNLIKQLQERFTPETNLLIESDPLAMAAYTGEPSAGTIDTKAPRKFPKVFFFRPPGVEGEYLEKLLTELDRDGVKTVLMTLPDYIGTYLTNFNKRGFTKAMDALLERHPGVVFLNYGNLKVFPLRDPLLFLDGGYGKTNSHLSREGAKRFAELYLPDLAAIYPHE